MSSPFISICVPTYKRADLLRRLFDSIADQQFRDFEVVITDNSDDDSVEQLVRVCQDHLPIRYYRNNPAVSMGENWNRNIGLARGEWIKMMHDDDWFSGPESLKRFAECASSETRFIYSSFYAVYDNGRKTLKRFGKNHIWTRLHHRYPVILFAENIIGPPTVTMVHARIKEQYDLRLKWRVDIDYYLRVLAAGHEAVLIDEPLINIGISEVQTTQSCLNNPAVEIPETLILLRKFGTGMLRNIIVYDAVWRLMRNMNIRNEEQLLQYSEGPWPPAIKHILTDQSRHAPEKLQKGWYSKLAMFNSWRRTYRNIGR